MKPTEAGEQIAQANYSLGIMAGYGRIARELRQQAGVLFAKDADEKAKIYRDLAAKYERQAEVHRQEHEKRGRPSADAAFTFLEGLETSG